MKTLENEEGPYRAEWKQFGLKKGRSVDIGRHGATDFPIAIWSTSSKSAVTVLRRECVKTNR